MLMNKSSELTCSCCGRIYSRRRVHALSDNVYICRRCGLWVALRLRADPIEHDQHQEIALHKPGTHPYRPVVIGQPLL